MTACFVVATTLILAVLYKFNEKVGQQKELTTPVKTEYFEFCFVTPTQGTAPYGLALEKNNCPIGSSVYRVEIIGTTTLSVQK